MLSASLFDKKTTLEIEKLLSEMEASTRQITRNIYSGADFETVEDEDLKVLAEFVFEELDELKSSADEIKERIQKLVPVNK